MTRTVGERERDVFLPWSCNSTSLGQEPWRSQGIDRRVTSALSRNAMEHNLLDCFLCRYWIDPSRTLWALVYTPSARLNPVWTNRWWSPSSLHPTRHDRSSLWRAWWCLVVRVEAIHSVVCESNPTVPCPSEENEERLTSISRNLVEDWPSDIHVEVRDGANVQSDVFPIVVEERCNESLSLEDYPVDWHHTCTQQSRRQQRPQRILCKALARKTHLCSKIGDDDEFLQKILRKDVSITCFFDIVRGDVDMVGSQVKIRRWDRSNTPFRLRSKCLCFEVTGGSRDDLVTMLVHCFHSGRC